MPFQYLMASEAESMMAAANCAVAVAASWPNKVALFPLILRSYFNQSKSQISCGLVLHERKWKNPNDLVVAVIIFLLLQLWPLLQAIRIGRSPRNRPTK